MNGINVDSFMGIFSAADAVSPLVLSIVASSMWEMWGREIVFGITFLLVLFAMAIMAGSHSKLDVDER